MKANSGQNMTELAGALLVSALIAGGCIVSAKTVMPVVYEALSQGSSETYEDETPASAGVH